MARSINLFTRAAAALLSSVSAFAFRSNANANAYAKQRRRDIPDYVEKQSKKQSKKRRRTPRKYRQGARRPPSAAFCARVRETHSTNLKHDPRDPCYLHRSQRQAQLLMRLGEAAYKIGL